MSLLYENLVILCWFYFKNCILLHVTNKNFSVTSPRSETLDPTGPFKVEVLKPPLHITSL